MRPKITWNVPRWADRAAWVPPLPALREKYGDDFGGLAGATEIVERAAARIASRGTKRSPGVRAQDVRATLAAIEADPEKAPRSRWDPDTKTAMQDAALRLFRDHRLAGMAPEQLRACAAEARLRLPSRDGQPSTRHVLVQMVAELLTLGLADRPKAERHALLEEAILACSRNGVGVKSLEAYEALARRGQVL